MALSKDKIKSMGWRSCLTKTGTFIFVEVFFQESTQEKIKELLNREYRAVGRKLKDSQSLSNNISNYLVAWTNLGYVKKARKFNKESKSKFHPKSNFYWATFKPYWEYLEEGGMRISKKLKKQIELLFNKKERDWLRNSNETLIETLNSEVKEMLFMILKQEISPLYSSKLSDKNYKPPYDIKLIPYFFDKFELSILQEYVDCELLHRPKYAKGLLFNNLMKIKECLQNVPVKKFKESSTFS
jgi:hypothetical protein